MNVVLQCFVAAARRTLVNLFLPSLLACDPPSVHSRWMAATSERWTLRGEGLQAAPLGARRPPPCLAVRT